jgi:hypothetical protein
MFPFNMGLLSQKNWSGRTVRAFVAACRVRAYLGASSDVGRGDQIGAHYITRIVPVNEGYERTRKPAKAFLDKAFGVSWPIFPAVWTHRDLPGAHARRTRQWAVKGCYCRRKYLFSTSWDVEQSLFVDRDPI